MHQIHFRLAWGSNPDPAGGAYSALPDPIAGFMDFTSKGKVRRRGRAGKGEGIGRDRQPPDFEQATGLRVTSCTPPLISLK